MLEKPIDAIEDKEQCNYYTYDKLQIKSNLRNQTNQDRFLAALAFHWKFRYLLAYRKKYNSAGELGSGDALLRHAFIPQ